MIQVIARCVLVSMLAVAAPAMAQTPLTSADAPSYPIIQPSSGNITGAGCDPNKPHVLWWVDQNLCAWVNQVSFISKDPSALVLVTVGGTVASGHVVTLNFIFGGSTRSVSYTTVAGDTATAVASALVAAIKANPNLFNAPDGGLPGQITYITNSFDGGLSFASVLAMDFDSRVTMTLSWTSTGAETLSYDPACDTTGCPKNWDNNPSVSCGRLVSGVAPPPNSVICNWMVVGAQSANPSALTIQYGNWGVQVQSSVSGSLMSRFFFTLPNWDGSLNLGAYIGHEGVYPVADNLMWSGHQSMRWSYVWGYIGDFATGLIVAGQPGLTTTKTVRKAGGTADCTLVFTGGLLTGGTC